MEVTYLDWHLKEEFWWFLLLLLLFLFWFGLFLFFDLFFCFCLFFVFVFFFWGGVVLVHSPASLSLVGDKSLVHELRKLAAAELHVNVAYHTRHPALKSVYGKSQSVIGGKLFPLISESLPKLKLYQNYLIYTSEREVKYLDGHRGKLHIWIGT